MTLPLGVHEFTARWKDGATVTRRVFVPQMSVSYDVNFGMNSSRSGGSMKYSGKPDAKKTVIVLKKPKKAS